MSKTPSQDPKSSTAPFGTEPRRTAWPLITLFILFIICFAFLVVTAFSVGSLHS